MHHFRFWQARRRGAFRDVDDPQSSGEARADTSSTSGDSTDSTQEASSAQIEEEVSEVVSREAFSAPTHVDVHAVRNILNIQLGVPMELVDSIINYAEYFPSVLTGRSTSISCSATYANDHKAAVLVLLSDPAPHGKSGTSRSAAPNDELIHLRGVRFRFESADQGWGGERPNTYIGAHSWLSAAIYRPLAGSDMHQATNGLEEDKLHEVRSNVEDWDTSAKSLGLRRVTEGQGLWRVQANLVAHRSHRAYHVLWEEGQEPTERDRSTDGGEDGVGFLETLQSGDRIGLFAEAQYPGWSNSVREASIEIMYSI